MYNRFFGFNEKPFEVTPDPKFLYMTRAYQEILSALIYGIRERRGFIAIVGEVGTGKTMMINALLDRLEPNTKVAFIFNSDLTFLQMLHMVLCDLGLARAEENPSKVEAIQRLNEFAIMQLEKGGNVVIVIDEAQSLNHKTMENLRMLSNLETRKHKLVQMVLSGQPELDAKLNLPQWRQLVQRISLKRYSTNLDESNSYGYIQHRLDVAGYKGAALFSQEALRVIWQYSEGIPRKINILCDNALLIGYGMEQKRIDADILKEAIKDLSWSPYLKPSLLRISSEEAGSEFSTEQVKQNSENIAASGSNDAQNNVQKKIIASSSEKKQEPSLEEIQTRPIVETNEFFLDEMVVPDLEERINHTALAETTISPNEEIPDDILETKSHQFRAAVITGILILLILTIAAWFFIIKPNGGMSELSNLQQIRDRIGTITRQVKTGNQTMGHTGDFKDENPQAQLKLESDKLSR